ncbi:MAG: bile acid:sodium symporter family protein [Bacteroidota bacterium]
MTTTPAIVLGISLIIIMFGMGLTLTLDDFKRVIVNPKAVLIGLVNQMIFLPAIGFLIIFIFPVSEAVAIGLILLAACPGGATSNLIAHLARGDTALSVSLTAVSSAITVITIPIIVNLGFVFVQGSGTAFQLDVIQTIGQVFIIVLIPISIGMLIRRFKTKFADKMDRPVKVASGVVFVLVVIGLLIKESNNIVPYFQQAGWLTVILNIATMVTGYASASLFRLNKAQRISISIESGIQNGTLAISIATVLLQNSTYAIAPAVYGLVMFATSVVVIYWGNRRK